LRRREDEEDVLESVYKRFCLRLRHGDFRPESRTDLWRLLVTMTLNKARGAAARHGRDRRDYRHEQPPADAPDSAPSSEWGLAHMEAGGPTPAEAAVLAEELRRRLDALPAELRRIALWKLKGYTNDEIAGEAMLDCSERTVARKLNLIRKKWAAMP
jgi:hypothetical protein